MAATVAGTFEDHLAAQAVVERLRAAGIPAANISMIARDRETDPNPEQVSVRRAPSPAPPVDPARPNVEPVLSTQVADDEEDMVTPEDYASTATGTAAGGAIGAAGGLLVSLGLLALPGLGPFVAAGPLAATLGGAAVGAATGGLIGALVDAGVPEEYAHSYATHIERGHVLLTVHTDDASRERVIDILRQAGASNLHPTAAV